MKHRNPLFVAGFPYITTTIGYMSINLFEFADPTKSQYTLADTLGIIACFIFMLVGSAYSLYWLIATAYTLKRIDKARIPTIFLLIIPLANLWWMWRYSDAAANFVQQKHPRALIFVLIVLLGPIGLGILQDIYNKTGKTTK